MKCLIVAANPSHSSFTYQLVSKFKEGLEFQGHTHESINLFDSAVEDFDIQKQRQAILDCDAICFAFPWWFEMPPYPLVAFFQKNLVEGFAFEHKDGIKIPKIKKSVQVIITMGQSTPEYNIRAVRDGLRYVGLSITGELVCLNVGQNLTKEEADNFLNDAYIHGKLFFK